MRRKVLPVFRVYAQRGAPPPALRTTPAADALAGGATTPLHRRLVFPADSLLRLGSCAGGRPHPRKAGRRCNPLDRRGRRSRGDPDYIYDEAEARAGHDRLQYTWSASRKRAPSPERDPWFRHGLGSAVPEWRRIEDEWARIIPARDLGARLFALWRVVDKPQCWIARTARRLYANRPLARQIADEPIPALKKPMRDRLPVPPALSLLAEVCATIPCFDTS